MAFAYCSNCRKAFRYRVDAKDGPAWLKEFARAVGKGEPAILKCMRCWFTPEVGDVVEITQAQVNEPGAKIGSMGRIVEIQNEDTAYPIFSVESLPSDDSMSWCVQFMRWEISASRPLMTGILRFNLSGSN